MPRPYLRRPTTWPNPYHRVRAADPRHGDENSPVTPGSPVGRPAPLPAIATPVGRLFAVPATICRSRSRLPGTVARSARRRDPGGCEDPDDRAGRDYEHENASLPGPGLRQAVVDSRRPVAVVETTAVRVIRLADVDLNHALGEGEGYTSVADWRAGHEQFWHSAEVRQALGDPGFTVGDDTLVVAQEFRLIAD